MSLVGRFQETRRANLLRAQQRIDKINHLRRQTLQESQESPPTWKIFVSVASYRDSQCPFTIADLFEKAQYPECIVVGCCQQNEDSDRDCLDHPTCQRYQDQIRVMRLNAGEAKGPVYARALVEQHLFQDETYFLLIDSHTVMCPHWDTLCIEQLHQCPSENPVLTCYPLDYDLEQRRIPLETLPVFLGFRGFHPRLQFSEQDRLAFHELPSQPVPSLFWGACFSFTLGSTVRQVPYDPHLHYVFLGEEISMAMRLFTHGFDTFSPSINLAFTYMPRHYRPTFWEQIYKKDGRCKVDHETRTIRKDLERQGNERVKALLTGTGSMMPEDPYGLGSVRSRIDFEQFVGLNFQTLEYEPRSKLGLVNQNDPEEYRVKTGLSLFKRV